MVDGLLLLPSFTHPLRTLENLCQGESGWCSDMTSIHGACRGSILNPPARHRIDAGLKECEWKRFSPAALPKEIPSSVVAGGRAGFTARLW